jgi:hypothetical protein
MIFVSTMEEYLDLITQVLFEIQDLRASVEYDEEFMSDALVLLDPLEASVRKLHRSVSEGDYEFSDQNLPFMSIVNATDTTLLPFKHLLIQINDTHRHGLSVDKT